MSREQMTQAVSAGTQQTQSALDGSDGSRHVVSPYLTAEGAVRYLALGSKSALYHHIRENRLPTCRIGRHLRFDVRELDAWVRGFGSSLEQKRSFRRSA